MVSVVRKDRRDGTVKIHAESQLASIGGPFSPSITRITGFTSFTTNKRYHKIAFHKKTEASDLINGLKSFILEVGTPKEIRMDRNATLIKNDPGLVTQFQQFCLDRGIALKISPPNHQEMNGVAEKSGRDLYEHATCLLYHAGISTKFWPYAVQHCADCFNALPRKSLKGESPFSSHFVKRPYIGHHRTFGCPCFLHRDKAARGPTAAFSTHVDRGIHLGNARDSPPGIYLVYKFETQSVCVTRDVLFDEHFRFVTRTKHGWVFQLLRLDNEYDTYFDLPPTFLPFAPRTKDVDFGLQTALTKTTPKTPVRCSGNPSSTSAATQFEPCHYRRPTGRTTSATRCSCCRFL